MSTLITMWPAFGVKGQIALRTDGVDDVADGCKRPSIDPDAAEYFNGLSLMEGDGQVGQRPEGDDAKFFRGLSDLFGYEDGSRFLLNKLNSSSTTRASKLTELSRKLWQSGYSFLRSKLCLDPAWKAAYLYKRECCSW
jgi:hypothetical protein